ncbi:MAG: symmetrical bis(5'-nucleosyl)-tetraphosphatase [Gammaproteobacteria bacterium]|nr:symmetrical bis(5'-nucleosyl)-tetraphosphatase [Gammaproteobacteria bacterium]
MTGEGQHSAGDDRPARRATYLVGDIQGCFESLKALLVAVGFGDADRLWCVGDLVNRGPASLDVLRFARGLGERFACVLGNHDLHFLAMVYGGHPHRATDTMESLLDAPDCADLADWLRHQPLLIDGGGWAVVHAGIPHIWTMGMARDNAREVEAVLRGPGHAGLFQAMYGNEPALWRDELEGMDRYRATVNYLTRMRLVDDEGRLEFGHKGTLDDLPAGYHPWFAYPTQVAGTLYFGHWAALDGATGQARIIGLDTGCVWGRTMTAVRLEDGATFSVPAVEGSA